MPDSHSDSIRIVLADDHSVLRSGLSMLVDGEDDMEVVGQAEDGDAALEMIRRLEPDVAIIDLSMPKRDGVEVIRILRDELPDVRTLALTMHDSVAHLRTVATAGASGYVVKSADDSELLSAIRAVASGRFYLDMSLDDDGLGVLLSDLPSRSGKSEILSPREKQVLELVSLGLTHREIAEKLGVSTKTVETYRGRFAEKLDLRSRAEVVRFALESGILNRGAAQEHFGGDEDDAAED